MSLSNLKKGIFIRQEKLHTKYWDKIPVLLKNNHELLWPFDTNDIQKFNSIY